MPVSWRSARAFLLHRVLPRTLAGKVLATFAALWLLAQSGVGLLAWQEAKEQSGIQTAHILAEGERMLAQLIHANGDRLEARARGAALAALGPAPNSRALQDARAAAGLSPDAVLAVLRPDLGVGHAIGGEPEQLTSIVARMTLPVRDAPTVPRTIGVIGDRIFQFVLVRGAGAPGWLLAGESLDAGLLDDLHRLSSVDAAWLVNAGRGWRAVASRLPVDLETPWAALLPTLAEREHATRTQDSPVPERLAQRSHPGMSVLRLANGAEASAVALLIPRPSVRRAGDDSSATWARELVAGVLVLLVGAVFTHRMLSPAGDLADGIVHLDHPDQRVPVTSRRDELGRAFRALRAVAAQLAHERAEQSRRIGTDALTRLPNRHQFNDMLDAAIAGDGQPGRQRPLAVVLIGLDHFKHINDVLGRRFADLLLAGTGDRLARQTVRRGDMVARLEGDVFAVLLHDADVELADAVARRLAASFDKPLAFDGQHIDVAASVGVACFPQHALSAEALVQRAQVALQCAKRRRQSPLLYNPAIDSGSSHTLSQVAELRHAISDGELCLHLQPKVALAGNRLIGAEALVRWQHPVRGLVPPLQFIPFAEQTGIVRPLTLWVLEECARTWLRFYEQGLRITLSMNISMHDLLDADLPARFDSILAGLRVPAEAFSLEIGERALMGDPARALRALESLAALGFRLSIDDFGLEWSCVPQLKRLPVDEIKIDRELIRQIESDVDEASLVRAAVHLAHQLGLSVVAEGVENLATCGLLQAIGCDEMQGHYVARAMPVDEFGQWAASFAARQSADLPADARPTLH